MLALIFGLALAVNAPDGSVVDRYQALSKEYEDQLKTSQQAFHKADHDKAKEAEAAKLAPSDADYAARFFALASEEPTGPAASDALYETLQLQPNRLTPMGREAIGRLRRDFLTSPKMANYVQQLALQSWPEIEPLLREILDRSPDPTARGLACQGLGNKLAAYALFPKYLNDPEMARRFREIYEPEHLAAIVGRDPAALLAEATAFHGRVVSEFADVRLFPAYPTDDRTIGQYSRKWLDGQQTVAIGQPAPAIEGLDLDGKPLRLADYRGKVVVLVFSASWCGPCLEQIPNEKALAARMQGRPFALLGVNCDYKAEEARQMTAREGINWPQWFDGDLNAKHTIDGPIRLKYAIQGIPAIFVLDEQGIIRERDVRGKPLDEAVDRLLDVKPTAKRPEAPGAARGPGG